MRANLLDGGPELDRSMELPLSGQPTRTAPLSGQPEKKALPGFRTHTITLLEKEWRIKWQRWTGSTRACCRCCGCCRRCPALPIGFICEVLFPLLVLIPLCYMAYSCIHPDDPEYGGCTSVAVGGFGGSIPQAVQNEGVTHCDQPDAPAPPPWDPEQPDQPQLMQCNTWDSSAQKAGSFLDIMLVMQAAGLKLAWVTKDAADRPKLDKMIHWISEQWYPGFADILPAALNHTGRPPVKMCYTLGQQSNNYLSYDQYDQACSYRYNNDPDPGCCIGSEDYGSFEQLQMPSLKTEADLLSYLENFDLTSYAAADGPGLMWAAVVFDKLGSGDGSPGSSGDWEYTIRLNTSSSYSIPDTSDITTLNGCTGYGAGCAGDGDGYVSGGFSSMQLMIDRYILKSETKNLNRDAALALNMESFIAAPSSRWGYPLDGYTNGDQAWQEWISDRAHVERINSMLAEPLFYGPETVITVPLPVADAVTNEFYSQELQFLGLFFVIAFLYTMYGVVVSLIQEKQTKVRESLKMMGVGTPSLIASVYLLHAAIFGVIVLVMTIYLTVLPDGMAVLPSSSPILVFLFLWLWCMAFVSFSFAFHTLFNRAMAGGLVSALLMLAQFIVYAVLTMSGQPVTGNTLYAMSLFPNCALCAGLSIITGLEATKVGATFASLSTTVNETTMGTVMGLLLLNIFLWTSVGWFLLRGMHTSFTVTQLITPAFGSNFYTNVHWSRYLEKVLPKEFGVQEKPWFIFTPTFWTRQSSSEPAFSFSFQVQGSGDVEALGKNDAMEEVSSSLKSLITLRGLRKTFSTPNGTKVAVHSLSLDCFEGQITALLGHNGAGKSTTINLLTGMTAPTAGDAQILGYDIKNDMPTIRKSIGCCPQHDVLWEQLTVQEHLNTFAKLKGLDPATSVPVKIAEVGLTEKVNVKAGELSGGMKRKLSLCMALIGDAKVIFLDEPTSGMDPFSRRSTWNMLIANRTGRAIVLTTHFMDEADLLGDRIAIMAEGELACCGSSLFLKNRYGAGYRLICTRNMNARCDASAIEAMLAQHVAEVKLLTDVGAEMTFQLPTERSHAFPAMLRQLDEQLEELGVQEYGVSQVTMEEVFLKVGKSATEAASGGTEASLERVSSTESVDTPLHLTDMKSHEVFLRHFRALAVKRLHYGRRDKASIFCALILPAIMLWVCIGLVKYESVPTAPLLVLDASMFERYTDSPVLPWNSSDDRPVPVTGSFAGKRMRLPPDQAFDSKFFGRTYDPTTGLPTDGSNYNPAAAYMDSVEPQRVLSMEESMWADGMGTTPDEVQWGGLLFPHATDAAHDTVTVLYNESASHGVPAFMNAAVNALRRRNNAGETGQITVSTQPLPEVGTYAQQNTMEMYTTLVIILIVAFAFVPSAMIAFPVMESEAHHNSRHQQYISGVSIPAYWLANYLWDVALFLVLMLTCVLSFQAFDVTVFTTQNCNDCASTSVYDYGPDSCYAAADYCKAIHNVSSPITCGSELPRSAGDVDQWSSDFVPAGVTLDLICPVSCGTCGPNPFGVVVLTLLGYGFAIIPVTYLFSLLFQKHTTAQMVTLLVNIVLGLFLVLTSVALSSSPDTKHINDTLLPFFRMSPSFNLGWSVLQITGVMDSDTGGSQQLPPLPHDLLVWDKCGASLFALLMVSLVSLPLVLFFDYLKNFPAVMSKIPFLQDAQVPEVADYEADEDVRAEEDRVHASAVPTDGQPHDDVIQIRNLRKVYGKNDKVKVAVRSLTLGLQKGTCFGFLGINGAGKTSTMNILTGAQLPTSGDAWLGSKNILTQQKDVRRLIGYCPQHDALLDKLTVREHLMLFGRIKGVAGEKLDEFVVDMMARLDLTAHEHKLASTLSGGNKRKLSVGIALMGSPQLVFLDEPSTGVDPAARRFMWDLISRLCTQRQECTVVLTTHNMEEAEALCSSIGIMVGGRLHCLGSNQRLKARFGNGYQLELKLKQPTDASVAQLVVEQALPPVMSSHSDVIALCERLGDPERGALVRAGCEEGYAMYSTLQQNGHVTAAQFAHWWMLEGSSRDLITQLNATFTDSVELLERHDRSFRFRVQMDSPAATDSSGAAGTTVASFFAVMEERIKSTVPVEEYSLSQGSLEQIFNQFAAKQEEETGAVRGMQQPAAAVAAGPAEQVAQLSLN